MSKSEVQFCNLCKNNSLNSYIQLMPENSERRKKWIHALGLKPEQINCHAYFNVCDDHLDDHFYKKDLEESFMGNVIPWKQISSETGDSLEDEFEQTQMDESMYSPGEEFESINENQKTCVNPSRILDDILFFVYFGQVAKLLKFCHFNDGQCRADTVGEPTYYTRGFMVVIKTKCIHGHEYKWRSMPIHKGLAVGNDLIPCAMSLAGNCWINLQSLGRLLNFVMPTQELFLRMYKRFFLSHSEESIRIYQ